MITDNELARLLAAFIERVPGETLAGIADGKIHGNGEGDVMAATQTVAAMPRWYRDGLRHDVQTIIDPDGDWSWN